MTGKTIRMATPTYATEEECKTTTHKKCAILMCDLIPAGQTYEEACGKGFKPGWGPLP